MWPNLSLRHPAGRLVISSQLAAGQVPPRPFKDHPSTQGVDVWQATETSHRKSRLVNLWQWNIHRLLVNRCSYQVMVKSLSAHCVRPSRLLSNPVTNELVTRDHVITPVHWSTADCWFTTGSAPSALVSSVVSFHGIIKWVDQPSY